MNMNVGHLREEMRQDTLLLAFRNFLQKKQVLEKAERLRRSFLPYGIAMSKCNRMVEVYRDRFVDINHLREADKEVVEQACQRLLQVYPFTDSNGAGEFIHNLDVL